MAALQFETIEPIDMRANQSNDGVWLGAYGYCQPVPPRRLLARVDLLGAGG